MAMFSSDEKTKIFNLFKKINKNTEFEVMFNNYLENNSLKLNEFMNVLKYLKYKSKTGKNKLKENISLDICYTDNTKNVFRGSIEGVENINSFLGVTHLKKNNLIFSTFLSQYLDKEGYSIIKKTKDINNKLDFNNYDIRFRLSTEENIDNDVKRNLIKLPFSQSDNILYRYKQRISYEIDNDMNIDMTIIKSSKDVNKLQQSQKTFELEIDYSNTNNNADKLKVILKELEQIKKVMLETDNLIKKKDEDNIIVNYKNLVYGSNNLNFNNLYSMHPVSAEVQHIIDFIPNKYAVSDKSDGEKYVMFIDNDKVNFISNNLNVKVNNDIKVKNLNKSIFEGEYIYLESEQKYIFMIYDCLFFKGKDIRSEVLFKNRYEYIYKLLDVINSKDYVKVKQYDGNYNIVKIKKHFRDEVKSFYDDLDKNIKKMNKNEVYISSKIILFPPGGNNSEVFLFADLIWNFCTKSSEVKCPYSLDGIIFTPLDQKYTRELKEQKLPIYKYKPPHLNSIDVYIKFERNRDTGELLRIFDNSIPDTLEFSSYQVASIFVGDKVGDSEKPVPFNPDKKSNKIYLPIVNGQVRDFKGNIVEDNTVVEIVYDNNSKLPLQYKWSVIRTRWDKTEFVIKYGKKYGNYKLVADKIWKSIKEAVTFNEINNLANPNTYTTQMNILKSRLDSSVIASQRQQDKYYQKITNLAKPMREFHNWIKSILIYTFASPLSNTLDGKKKRQSFLDIGCGRGGDILKVYHARVGEYVGIDVDFEGIYSATDGAISRFNYLKKKFPDFGKVSYLQADGGIKFDVESQEKSLTSLSNENKNMIEKVFKDGRKFDVFNFQFSIHYLFANKQTISNMISNIKKYLSEGGYILITIFDAERVDKLLKNGDYKSMYTDEDGNRNIFYGIKKKYDGDLSDNVGNSIDVHMSWINEEDKYIEEFLVTKELMIKTMKEADCKLVDTDLFENLYNLNKPYFSNVIKYEENPKNKQFYEKVASFYDKLTGVDKESKDYSFLYRYFVFRKN